jgi:hypothetical protein
MQALAALPAVPAHTMASRPIAGPRHKAPVRSTAVEATRAQKVHFVTAMATSTNAIAEVTASTIAQIEKGQSHPDAAVISGFL